MVSRKHYYHIAKPKGLPFLKLLSSHTGKFQWSEVVVRRCSVKKVVLRNFAKFTGKHLCQRLFFNKIADLRPATLLKKSLWHRRFPVNFAKILRTAFFTEHLQWLLLNDENPDLKEDSVLHYSGIIVNGYVE